VGDEDVRHHGDLFAMTNDLATKETTVLFNQIHPKTLRVDNTKNRPSPSGTREGIVRLFTPNNRRRLEKLFTVPR